MPVDVGRSAVANAPGPEARGSDVRSGLLSREKAERDYGVVFVADGIDAEATAARREALRAGRSAPAAFEFGPERDEHDRIWPPAIRARLAEAAMSVTPSLRYHLLSDIRARMNEAGESVDEARLDAAVADWVARHGGTGAQTAATTVHQAAE